MMNVQPHAHWNASANKVRIHVEQRFFIEMKECQLMTVTSHSEERFFWHEAAAACNSAATKQTPGHVPMNGTPYHGEQLVLSDTKYLSAIGFGDEKLTMLCRVTEEPQNSQIREEVVYSRGPKDGLFSFQEHVFVDPSPILPLTPRRELSFVIIEQRGFAKIGRISDFPFIYAQVARPISIFILESRFRSRRPD
jgi:hypothetical protein